jgi:hypothetical protein
MPGKIYFPTRHKLQPSSYITMIFIADDPVVGLRSSALGVDDGVSTMGVGAKKKKEKKKKAKLKLERLTFVLI